MSNDTPPILFLIFNRPETTRRVFEAIRLVRPDKLYIAADGPRLTSPRDPELCAQTRKVLEGVDWPCEVKTLFRRENIGCREAVSGAIDWFFKQEEEGIILEDDCLPDLSFFRYCKELLERYRNDDRIMAIGAQHFHGTRHRPNNSYFFSRYFHCWGWATWRRAWQHYDVDMVEWPELRATDWLLDIGDGSRWFQAYWKRTFDRVALGEIDTWDYQWLYLCWLKSGLCILPTRNLVTNIGFGGDATHTSEEEHGFAFLPMESIGFPLEHPIEVSRDIFADNWTTKNVYGITMLRELVKKLKHSF